MTHAEFLELILRTSCWCATNVRSLVESKRAASATSRRLEEFDWSFNPAIKRSQIYDLATGRFIKQRRDVLLCLLRELGKVISFRGSGIN